jgi:hypothetical protein
MKTTLSSFIAGLVIAIHYWSLESITNQLKDTKLQHIVHNLNFQGPNPDPVSADPQNTSLQVHER